MTAPLDPISLNDVTDLDNLPFIIEGDYDGTLKFYIESEDNKQVYLDTLVHGSDDTSGLKKIYQAMADNPSTGSIN